MWRGCHRRGGTGTRLPCCPLLYSNPAEPRQTLLSSSPRLTLPGRGGARRGAHRPHCGRRRKGQPLLRRSPAPGSRSVPTVAVPPLGQAPRRPGGRGAGRGYSTGGPLRAAVKGAAGPRRQQQMSRPQKRPSRASLSRQRRAPAAASFTPAPAR